MALLYFRLVVCSEMGSVILNNVMGVSQNTSCFVYTKECFSACSKTQLRAK